MSITLLVASGIDAGDSRAQSQPETAPTTSAASRSDLDQIADYLRVGYWADANAGFGIYSQPRSFEGARQNGLTFNVSGLPQAEKFLITSALQAWSDATGLQFRMVSSSTADLVFQNTGAGAFSSSFLLGDSNGDGAARILQSVVNVSSDWDSAPKSLNSYWFQTYVHEIGHALGLGHAGNYDALGGADITFENSTMFRMDSWQASVMSYWAQNENPRTRADFAYLATIMPADILAIQGLYGTNVSTRPGNSVYGHNSNITGYLRQLFEAAFDNSNAPRSVYLNNSFAFTLIDSSGNDTLNFASMRSRQIINLNPGKASSVGGIKGNLLIAFGTVIENAIGGKNSDKIFGNGQANRLAGREAGDRLVGSAGNDTLSGDGGNDRLLGGSGRDLAVFTSGGSVKVDLARTRSQDTGQGNDSLLQIENLLSGKGNDRLSGSAAANRLNSGAGNDMVQGRADTDTLTGGSGRDKLFGGTGADALSGGPNRDRLVGGAQSDTLDGGADADTLIGGNGPDDLFGGNGSDLGVGGSENDALQGGPGNDRLRGDGGDDSLAGGDADDRLLGGTGTDTVAGGRGSDTLQGDAGNDALSGDDGADRLIGGSGADSIDGGNGNDTLQGDAGNDVLSGNDGADRLVGDLGDDSLTGGFGADTFVISTGGETITDFEDAVDTLHLGTALWGGTTLTIAELLAFATVDSDGTLFRFANGATLRLSGLTDPQLLSDDIIIF